MGNCKVPEALANCCKFYHCVSFLWKNRFAFSRCFQKQKRTRLYSYEWHYRHYLDWCNALQMVEEGPLSRSRSIGCSFLSRMMFDQCCPCFYCWIFIIMMMMILFMMYCENDPVPKYLFCHFKVSTIMQMLATIQRTKLGIQQS